jgi:DNA-directed RNA polymerase specialized sigma24 family protein
MERTLDPARLGDHLDRLYRAAWALTGSREEAELYAAVAALSDEFRDVLVAVDVAGLSYKEAARALKIREGTVMSRLYRARRQVVRRIEGG